MGRRLATNIVPILLLVTASLGACGPAENAVGPKTGLSYATAIPHEDQPAGDATAGYQALLEKGYFGCGIPYATYFALMQPTAADKIPGRSGDGGEVGFNWNVFVTKRGNKVVGANCLACHAGKVNGQITIGLGNAHYDAVTDLQPQLDILPNVVIDPALKAEAQLFADRFSVIAPYRGRVLGVNPAHNTTLALFAHKDPQTLAWSKEPIYPEPADKSIVPLDTPPWWRMKKKNALYATGQGRGVHAHLEMLPSVVCVDSVSDAEEVASYFGDISAWIASLDAPKYPLPVDATLAAKGKTLFEDNCSRCHGTYGDKPSYPSYIVDINEVGTDDTYLNHTLSDEGQHFDTWLKASFYGQGMTRVEAERNGYVSPPLDGIWTTAPFFHNGSVPSIELVLNSKKRPRYWTRTFDTNDYDVANMQWKWSQMDHGQDAESDPMMKSRIYDTTQKGYGNGGHKYGDVFSDAERNAVLEYLKTL